MTQEGVREGGEEGVGNVRRRVNEGVLKFACISIQGWRVGKGEQIIIEMEEAGIDLLGVTETQ